MYFQQTDTMNPAQIFLFDGMFVYIGPGLQVRNHACHALEIGISLDDTFIMQEQNGTRHETRAVMIAPDFDNQCMIPASGRWLHIGIEPEANLAINLIRKYLSNSSLLMLNNKIISSFADNIKLLLSDHATLEKIDKLLQNFLTALLGYAEKPKILDYRIKKVVQILKEAREKNPALHELSAQVELSGGRLVHLFKEEIGIPIRRYMLWVRINRAIMELVKSKNLTEAAHAAGFADSAHFSRTFLRMFGIQPSEIFKNSQIVLVDMGAEVRHGKGATQTDMPRV